MRQNCHNLLSSRYCNLISVPCIRFVQATACAAAFCLSLGVMTPAHAQAATPATQEKKSKKKAHAAAPPKTTVPDAAARVVVVFPPETKGGVSDQISDSISDVVQSRLNLTGKYKTVYFLPSSPTIRRALIENTITKDEVDKPVATDTRIKKLTMLTGHDMACVVSIIDYQFDKATNKVSMVLSAKLLDYTAGAAPHGTNRNGDSPDKPSAKATEYDLASALARNLTEQMMNDLLGTTKPADTGKK
jgi:hypothetical protein